MLLNPNPTALPESVLVPAHHLCEMFSQALERVVNSIIEGSFVFEEGDDDALHDLLDTTLWLYKEMAQENNQNFRATQDAIAVIFQGYTAMMSLEILS